jgi:hypothetical protein
MSSAGEAKANGHYIHSNFVMLSIPNEIASTSAQMKSYSLAQFEAGTPIAIAYQLATHNEPYLSAEEL